MACHDSSLAKSAAAVFLLSFDFLLLFSAAAADHFNCSVQKLPSEHRLCTCLDNPAEASPAPSAAPSSVPAPAPAAQLLLWNLSCARTSWCMCLPKPLFSNSSLTGLIEAPLDPSPIQALFLRHSFEKLLHCTGCMCPRSSLAVSSTPASVPAPTPSSRKHPLVNGYSVTEEFTLCLSCNCTTWYTPSPASSASPAPSRSPVLPPSPPSPASSPVELDDGTVDGVYIARRLPPPRVTITNVHSKTKVLAYVLPVVGFAACGIGFITVVLWKNLLWFCHRTSSSSAVSSFSHLENEVP